MKTAIISLGAGREAAERAARAMRCDVVIQRAVDYRAADPQSLFDQGKITASALLAITQGRRAHHELPSTGAAGYWQSQIAALRRWRGAWLMICDEDVVFLPGHLEAVHALLRSGASFDYASFGVGTLDGYARVYPSTPSDVDGWVEPSLKHFGSHCVLWSPSGTRRALRLLLRSPQDLQFDVFVYLMHATGYLDGLVQEERVGTAKQMSHSSTIQSDCSLCPVPPRHATHLARRRAPQSSPAPLVLATLAALAVLAALVVLAALPLLLVLRWRDRRGYQ
jgi:hypothetical protein